MRNGKNLFVEKVDASEAAFSEVFPLLLELHKTVGVFRLNPSKMAEQCYVFWLEECRLLSVVKLAA